MSGLALYGSIARYARRAKYLAGDARDCIAALDPARRARARELAVLRAEVEPMLDDFSRQPGAAPPSFGADARILIDGMWDNANYWLRYALVRRAFGLAQCREVGLIGRYQRAKVTKTFERFGVGEIEDFQSCLARQPAMRGAARALLDATDCADDVMRWKLPWEFPAASLYDSILKQQRRASVDVADPNLIDLVAYCLRCIHAAHDLVAQNRFDLIVLSHHINPELAPIAHFAIRAGIPCIVIYGDYGVARFTRLFEPPDMFDYHNRPDRDDMAALDSARAAGLEDAGRQLVDRRLAGLTTDLGARHAFGETTAKARLSLAEQFGWDADKPVIGVYMPNWFDYPHCLGMTNFRDFGDWAAATIAVAKNVQSVNWLFKPHPLDAVFGKIQGPKLVDMLPTDQPHIAIVPDKWNGRSLMRNLDGIVTFHGSIGVEATAMGIPVLVADVGWYGDLDFVRLPASRTDYLDILATPWWEDFSRQAARRLALQFAGWYWCCPAWQGAFVLLDDSRQERNYADHRQHLEDRPTVMAREADTIRQWYDARTRLYHVFKMRSADAYAISNIAA